MLVELRSEVFDDLFKKILIEDWKNVKSEIKRLKRLENRTRDGYEQELKFHKKLKKSYEYIIKYTHSYEEAEEIIGKKEKKLG